MSGQMSKADGRRSGRHAAYYDGLFPRVQKRKDRNVARSSHGKFKNRAELMAYHAEKVGKTHV